MNRTSKDIGQYLITVYHWIIQQKIKIKVLPLSSSQNHIHHSSYNKVYFSQFQYQQTPMPLQLNFDNMQEIYEEIRVTSKDKFNLKQNKLQIKLQIGSKFKKCQFELSEGNFSYQQQIQILLWQTQMKLQKAQMPQHPYFTQVNQLKLINQRHCRQISLLNQKILQQKQNKVQLQHSLQQQINQMRIQLFEIKMYYQQLFNNTLNIKSLLKNNQIQIKSNNNQQISCQVNYNDRMQQSSLIYQQKISLPQIINIEEQNKSFKQIQLISQKFFFDKINISDIQLSYKRIEQRLTFKKYDNRSRQFNSIVQLQHPVSLINFKLIKTHQHNIYVGVLLFDRIRLISTRRDRGAISYKLKGELYQDGVKANVNLKKVNHGQTLSLYIDGKNKRIRWYLQTKLLVDRFLPFSFNGKELYPFINMVNEGDQIQII